MAILGPDPFSQASAALAPRTTGLEDRSTVMIRCAWSRLREDGIAVADARSAGKVYRKWAKARAVPCQGSDDDARRLSSAVTTANASCWSPWRRPPPAQDAENTGRTISQRHGAAPQPFEAALGTHFGPIAERIPAEFRNESDDFGFRHRQSPFHGAARVAVIAE